MTTESQNVAALSPAEPRQLSFTDLPRNRIKTYKVFRNSTFKFVSPNESILNKMINGSNPSNIFINNVNKEIMMRKISEVTTPYSDLYAKDINKNEFKRILPHPIIDDNRFKHLLEEAVTKNNDNAIIPNKLILRDTQINVEQTGQQIIGDCNENMKDENIEKYEEMLLKRLEEIRLLKEKVIVKKTEILDENPKCIDPIFKYQSNKLPDDILNYKKDQILETSISTEIMKDIEKPNENSLIFLSKNTLSKAIVTDEVKQSATKVNDELLPYYFHGTGDNIEIDKTENLENNLQFRNEFEVDIEDPKYENESIKEDNSHIPLFFKSSNGKKIRFKIRYFGKMAQAFKAFSSRMNITFISDIQYSTVDGRVINSTDTPQSLSLKPYDIIMVTNS